MNERRRTLLFSGGYKIPTENGVYIESVGHKFYLPDDWNSANTANSIAVVADEHKFRIALTRISSAMAMNPNYTDPWDTYLLRTTNSGITDMTVAMTDYNGATNTNLIVTKCQSATTCAAGACNAYTFPDGVTKGYLPALGELYLADKNMDAINSALSACGGTTIPLLAYQWSSTFYGKYGGYCCWLLAGWDGTGRWLNFDQLYKNNYVRAFGALEDSN